MASNDRSDSGGPGGKAGFGFAGLGVAAFMVVCCGSAPLLIALAGGVGAAALLGAGGALVAALLAVVAVVAVVRRRRRRACELPSRGGKPAGRADSTADMPDIERVSTRA